MKEEGTAEGYDPHSPFTTPFTIISSLRHRFSSLPLQQPFYCEVYCPLSCKKVKVGLEKEGRVEAVEFNSTTNRIVSLYANDTLRFLVNAHRPNKNDKRTLDSQHWSLLVDVQDKGNLAIFNPYCVDPSNPLTFYTFSPLSPLSESPVSSYQFSKLTLPDHIVHKVGDRDIYFSPDFRWVGSNPFFQESHTEQTILTDPRDPELYLQVQTRAAARQIEKSVFYWLNQLQNIIKAESSSETDKIQHNLDQVYGSLAYFLTLQEQLRARLMSAGSKKLSQETFKYHPRLYSAFERLGSFLNYGNTKYDLIGLAEAGFYNKSDMLQDLAYCEYPEEPVPNAEETTAASETALREKLFPFARMVRELPFPNVPLNSVISSLPAAKISETQVVAHDLQAPYGAFLDKEGVASLWSLELMTYKMLEFRIHEDISPEKMKRSIPVSEIEKQAIIEATNPVELEALFDNQAKDAGTKEQQKSVEADQSMLDQIVMMGYGPSTVRKALIKVNNESVVAALDAIEQIQLEEKQKNKDKVKQNWICPSCTYMNEAGAEVCEVCAEVPSFIEMEEQAEKLKQEEEQVKAETKATEAEAKSQQEQEEELLRQEEERKAQEEKERRETRIKNSKIIGMKLLRYSPSPVDPFFICFLLQAESGQKYLRVFRAGLSSASLLKFYRIEEGAIISNFNRKVYLDKSLQAVSQLVRESRKQIEWGCKLFEPASIQDWEVLQCEEIEVDAESDGIILWASGFGLTAGDKFISLYEIATEDTLESCKFSLLKSDKPKQSVEEPQKDAIVEKPVQKKDAPRFSPHNELALTSNLEEICVQVVEHLPAGAWAPLKKQATEVPSVVYAEKPVMSEFLPLVVEHFEGSLFSNKYSSVSILDKSANYISNYPNVSFAFKSQDNRSMLIESVSVISNTNKVQKIFSITSGLIFTANELSWFGLAKKKFSNMQKKQYDEWLQQKLETNTKPAYWEPVAYFDISGEVEFEIAFKRVAKYLFFLPTGVNRKENQKDEVIALKIEFFGAKGRIEDHDEETDLIENFKVGGIPQCSLCVEEQDGSDWVSVSQDEYLLKVANSANTYHYLPPCEDQQLSKIPLSVSSVFSLRFKNRKSGRRVRVKSDNLEKVRVLKVRETQENKEVQTVVEWKDLVNIQNKVGGFELANIVENLDLKDLVLAILAGPSGLTSYENLLTKILRLPNYEEVTVRVMSAILPTLCSEKVEVSSVGFQSFMRFYEKLVQSEEEEGRRAICGSWMAISSFTDKVRNKNYNILRNVYKIEDLVLEPALFSKDYYRLVHPKYVEEEKVSTITSEPQTPINCQLYMQSVTPYNFVYTVDLMRHADVQKIELYFPKLSSAQKFKMVIKIVEVLATEGEGVQEKQIYYRYFHEDTLYQLSFQAFKDTEIYTKSHINYLSIPGDILSPSARIIRVYADFLVATTVPHNRYKDFPNNFLILPVVYSHSHKNTAEIPAGLQKWLESFPKETKHNQSQQKMPPHRFSSQNNKLYCIVHEFKSKFTQEVKSQLTEVVERITQNILDKKIVEESIQTIRISQYQLEYKGLDFAYTFLIALMKLFRRLPGNSTVPVADMFTLFDTFVLHEVGPIMSITSSTLCELYKRASASDQEEFARGIIERYLLDAEEIKALKMSEKYSVKKIIEFLSDFQLPIDTLFKILQSHRSVFSTSITLTLILNILKKFGMALPEGTMKASEVIEIVFDCCNWILGNVSGLKSELLCEGLDLLLLLLSDEKREPNVYNEAGVVMFIQNVELKDFWRLVFLTLRIKNDTLSTRIHSIFKIFTKDITPAFHKSINGMLLDIIKKEQGSAYLEINPGVSDDVRMGHLQTILEYLSLTNSKVFLDITTSKQILALPLTPTLWSLILKIIPRENAILPDILKNFKDEYYSSLGREIMAFCEPLTGIKALECPYINWLELVRKIRIEGKSVLSLFVESLRECNFGGRSGVTMAHVQDVKKLEIACEFARLVSEGPLVESDFTIANIEALISWFYLNYTTEAGASPASDLLKTLSGLVFQIFEKVCELTALLPVFIEVALSTRKKGEIAETLFEQKRLSSSNALFFNKKLSECFETLINLFCVSDELHSYFAFDVDGIKYILEKIGLNSDKASQGKQAPQDEKISFLQDEEYLLSEGLVVTSAQKDLLGESKLVSITDLKEQEFATNAKLVPDVNQHGLTNNTVDWTQYKKGNKTKIVFLPMSGPTFNEYCLYLEISRPLEVRSIKVGFPAVSYEFTDKLVASPSAVTVEGSMDMKFFEPLGELTWINDDGYTANGVKSYVLNLQRLKSKSMDISESLSEINCHHIRYIKIVVKRPVVALIEGQFSPLNGRPYKNLGCSLSYLSVLGDDLKKLPFRLVSTSCREIAKESALTILSAIVNESNPSTVKKIANSAEFVGNFKANFHVIIEHMKNYPAIVPSIVYALGSNNEELGDWLINKFLSEGQGDTQASIINQIITNSEDKIFSRLRIFLSNILIKLHKINDDSGVESGFMYVESVSFIESFCKTLEESYDHKGLASCSFPFGTPDIEAIVNIFDKRYSSPEIKTLVRFLVALVYVRPPLQISTHIITTTLDLVWKNCSETKPYFYQLLGALLVNNACEDWLKADGHQKTRDLLAQIRSSIEANSLKLLSYQSYLLMIISSHESRFLRDEKVHFELYNKLKNLIYEDSEVLDNFTKVIQNVVLDDKAEEEALAKQLIADVGLLVKRKDPILLKFYVGVLGLEKEVFVNLKGFDVSSNGSKKEAMLQTKFLNKSQIKALSDKINKKIKFNLVAQADGSLGCPLYNSVYSAINSTHFLLLVKIRLSNGKLGYAGCYSPGKSFRTEEDSYCWQDAINYDKGSFIFWMNDGETKFYESSDSGQHMLSLFGGEEELDEMLVLYENSNQILRVPFNVANEPYINFPGSTNCKIESFEFYNGSLKAPTVGSNKLVLCNKAKAPYNLYRYPNVYVFPARISIAKFKNILGVKGKCLVADNTISEEELLGSLSGTFPDSIVDISVLAEDPDEDTRMDEGYIPEMNVFEKYSALGGVNEVLEIGAKSIQDWKKPERRKNFDHYMSELKTFVHLPNFFSLFVKNQESVTFLFEVASGMPDDPNSTRNWEQQEVNSSKFIYKILSNIFKYDHSEKLRDLKLYGDFCEIILEKLAEISKETVREVKEESEEREEVVEKVEKKEEPAQKKKKKGTGYGADNQNNSKWSAQEWIEHRKNVAQEIERVVCILVSFLDCETSISDPRLSQIIKSSCLLPLLQNALRSGSLLDMSKEADLFKNYLLTIKNMAKNSATVECLLELDKKYKPAQTESIYSLLKNLNGIAAIFIDCLKSGKGSSENDVAAEIAVQIEKTYNIVDKAVKKIANKKEQLTIKQLKELPVSKSYPLLLQNLRFGYADMRERKEFQHFYASTISTATPSTAKILRLSQELADLSNSLPCEYTNSIFVRCDKERIDVVKILIMGSKDTPYSNGAFMFDLYCDDSYPSNPPKMSITTTGGGKIRFNPNLYAEGKVCLSLLGTWRGQASENWDPKVSTLLQLFISTQGITMSEDVYFNEPGFESEQGTPTGDDKNEGYSNIVRLGNVRYAMNGQLKNPPKGFEEVISKHFYIKKKEILEEVAGWIQQADKKKAEYSGLVSDHNSTWSTELKSQKGKYKELLTKEFEELKILLDKIPQPSLQEKEQEVVFESQKAKKKTRAKEAKLGDIDVSYEPHNGKELDIEEGVMQDRWSRYIGAMGIEAVKKQAESKVLLLGLKPLGLEIAKNLTLSGLKQLSIFDDRVLEMGSEEHFYMSDMKGKRIEECIHKVKELNPYMLVKLEKQIPSVEDFSMVVSTLSIQESLPISEACRKHNKQFIHCQTQGVSGFYFADLGQDFVINDVNGEEPFEGLIKSISCQEKGVVTLLDGVKHTYEDGDYVVLDRVEGMELKEEQMEEVSEAQTLYNQMSSSKVTNSINGKVFKIEVISWNSFRIGDTRNYGPYIRGGTCKNIKVPKKVSFKSFKESLANFSENLDPNMAMYDFEKIGDNEIIFACFNALSEFKHKHGRAPENWNKKDADNFVAEVKKTFGEGKSEEQIQKAIKFAHHFSYIAEAELPTLGAYLGGLVSQEVMKGLTNKYTPIKQFFTFHVKELAQVAPEGEEGVESLHVKHEEAFGNLKIVVGRDSYEKITKMKTFVIGAGAIGCELLKNFAMINMGAQGTITVTDPDHIETSNLTRQFLFRQKHVKKPKSATASATLQQMNPLLKGHISARLDKVCEETEDIYSDEFFDSQTVIANALDNVKARIYVDKRCVNNLKPLFESGTLGPKGHVQVIVPKKTENYGNQADPTEENQIPHCTLKMFPQETEHCIEWSRDIFGKVFTLNPKALKKVIEAKDPAVVEGQEQATVSKMLEHLPLNFEDCVAEAVRKFYRYFRNNVRQLLHTYPLDMKTKDGKLFWDLPKRPPKQINELDSKDENHKIFISSYSTLLARLYAIPYPKNFRKPEGRDSIMEIAMTVKVEDFVPDEEESKKMQKMTEQEEKEKQSSKNVMTEDEPLTEEPSPPVAKEQHKITLNAETLSLQVSPEEFEKDEDSNGHIDLIYSMSNLRSRNYGLNECTWMEAKLKAGKIMAALSTTTSVVAALQTIEIMKLVAGCEQWRNAFVNLAVPLVQISEPGEVPKHKIANSEFTVWDIWEFKCETLKDLLSQLREKHEVEGFNISTSHGKPVFWEAMYKDKEEAKEALLNRPLKMMFADEIVDLNVLMRSLDEQKKAYDSVPRVRINIV